MEHAESATRNAGLQGGNSWLFTMTRCLKKDAVMFAGVRFRANAESRRPAPLSKTGGYSQGQVHHRELMCRIFDGNEEVARRSICRWSCSLAYRKSMTAANQPSDSTIALLAGGKSGD